MVLQNRLDYGFDGYQVPPIPRATRSARRRGTFINRVDDKHTCAFDLLASVAGNLLLERSPPSSCDTSTVNDNGANVKIEKSVENTSLKLEPTYPGNCGRELLVSELPFAGHDQDCSLKKYFSLHEGCSAGFSPKLMISYATMNTSESDIAENLANKKTNEMVNFVGKVDVGSPCYTKSCGHNLDSGNKIIVKNESEKVLSGAEFETRRLNDPVVCDWKTQTSVGSENGFKLPSWKDHGPQRPCPTSRVDGKLVGRNVADNSFGRPHPTTSRNLLRTAPRVGGQRIRKILASKNWKVAAKYGTERTNIGGYTRQFYFNRRNSYKNQRSQMNIPFKKRKLFDGCFSNRIGGRMIEEISELTQKGTKRESSARGKSSLIAGLQGDSRVKLRIKSFRVPELFIEIPETATVSSLKRTVMEAVTTIVGHGIHVGVLIRGKKVRDDNKTLFQSGISHDNQDDSLGFSLEPHASQTPSSLCDGDPPPSMFPCSSTPEPITRCLPNPTVDCPGRNSTLLLENHTANFSNSIGSDHDPVHSLADIPVEKISTDSKALVDVPAMTVETLAVVPVCPKPNRLEVSQRRIRRPFSVFEVEALVHAVETLGTGRWRDVKLRAFDNAKHRTYVDLKDKWKTLVHTARISPQQRRGEAVPQEVLDRVLTAHAYWSQQQVKQLLKHQPDTCLLLP